MRAPGVQATLVPGRIRTLVMHFNEPRTEGRASHASWRKERLLHQTDPTLKAALDLHHQEHTRKSQALHRSSSSLLTQSAGLALLGTSGPPTETLKTPSGNHRTPCLGLCVGSAQVPTDSFKSLLWPPYSLVSGKNADPPTPNRSVRCISDLCRLATVRRHPV